METQKNKTPARCIAAMMQLGFFLIPASTLPIRPNLITMIIGYLLKRQDFDY